MDGCLPRAKGTDASGTVKRVSLTTPLHPSLQRAYTDVLRPYWLDTILPLQGLLEDEKYFEPVLAMIPVAEVRDRVGATWRGGRKTASAGQDESVARWGKLETEVSRAIKARGSRRPLQPPPPPQRYKPAAAVTFEPVNCFKGASYLTL